MRERERGFKIINIWQNLPFRLGCDWGREACECDVIRLRGRSSELCTEGLNEPGESVILVRSVFAALSLRCDFGLYCKFLRNECVNRGRVIKIYFAHVCCVAKDGAAEGKGNGDIHISSIVVRSFDSTRPGVDWQRPIAT